MKTPLCNLAEKYACDKTPSIRHTYTSFYHHLLSNLPIRRVFEIGVAGGASMRMWRDYFPEAEIFGIDNDPVHIFQDERIHTALCDASHLEKLASIAEEFGGNYDLIIDDGSHYPDHQINSFKTLLPFLAPSGVYIIEDVLHLVEVSDQILFPHEIYRFGGCANPSDDNLIVYFNGGNK
jgi:predicted O-methyltransferase YrrM